MEGDPNHNDKLSEYTNIYLSRLAHYSAYGALIGSVLSTLMFLKMKRGLLFGLGLGAGYCHEDLTKVYETYYSKKKTHSLD
jgi:hypothetical protein